MQHWFAVILFAGYATLLIIHARAGFKTSDTVDEYFVGGRRFGGAVIGAIHDHITESLSPYCRKIKSYVEKNSRKRITRLGHVI